MPAYRISRFNAKVGDLKIGGQAAGKADWDRAKGGSFIDWYTKKKAVVPPPNVYEQGSPDRFYRKQPSYSIYKSPRKTDFAEIIAIAEKRSHVGPTSLDPTQPQEKVPGVYGGVGERVTVSESIMQEAHNVPGANKYSFPNFVSHQTSRHIRLTNHSFY